MWHRRAMLRTAWAVLAIAACGGRGEPSAEATPGSAPRPVVRTPIDAGGTTTPPVVTAPHGAQIAVVAVGDAGDVAVSADEQGELRFWPALDGKREPVVVHGRMPVDLAMAREHDGHVVAVLDAANGIELIHLTAEGGVRDRQVLPTEPGFQELAAGESALLARRSDHAIVRLDANDPKGRHALESPHGEQLLAVAARGAVAMVGIADHDRPAEIELVREIKLADLSWGTTYELPVPLAAPIAVSPSGHRIAGLHARTGAGVVIDLLPKAHVVGSDVVGTDPDEHVLGFLDEQRVVFRGGVVLAVPQITAAADPWSGTRSRLHVRLGRGSAVGNDIVVGGHGTHLLLADPDRTRFLGYRDLGVGFLRVTGPNITLGFGNRILWLDDQLRAVRDASVLNDAAGGIAIDDHRLLKATYSYLENDRSKLEISVLDVPSGREEPLGSWSQGSSVAYDPHTNVFAVSGYSSSVARAQLDPIAERAKPLPALKTKGDSTIEILDPAIADGTAAIAYSFSESGMHVDTFVADTRNHPLSPATSLQLDDVIFPLGVDERGTLYSLASRPAEQPKPLYAHKAGKEVRKLMVDGHVTGGAVDRAGSMLALFSNSEVMLLDLDGKERWRIPAWSINVVRFTADGKTLLVNTQGGLLALDTATGKRRAAGCGWGFGLYTEEPQLTVFMAPVVCAEAP